MKERPIIFSAPMVRAILAGRKTVTRRLVTVPWKGSQRALPYEPYWVDDDGKLLFQDEYGDYHPATDALGSRFGEKGDRLWVRETFGTATGNGIRTVFRAGSEFPLTGWDDVPPERRPKMTWIPSIFMRRRESRITLEVVDVRVERLQAITPQDVCREGAEGPELESLPPQGDVNLFAELWDSLNAKRAPWESNPWVWRVEFRRVQ